MIGVYKIFRKDRVLCIYLYSKYSKTVILWILKKTFFDEWKVQKHSIYLKYECFVTLEVSLLSIEFILSEWKY